MKIVIGPVPPRIVSGCPPNSANRTPPTAVATSISVVPIWPPVTTSVRPPKAIAFARHAKKRKSVDATTFGWKPWAKSST